MMILKSSFLFFLLCMIFVSCSSSETHPDDVAALKSLRNQWKNVPPNWKKSDDPCGAPWEGINCTNTRVVKLVLFNMDIQGTLSKDIGNLSQLQSLDLSTNKRLSGPLPSTIGNLAQLTSLKLVNCSLSGTIPNEIGNLSNLTYLAMNANQFTGNIPASLGKLSKLYWLDLADNQLNGSLPVSANQGSGLDQLLKAQHFHFNQNQLSGEIPASFFSAGMVLIHILLDRNQLKGPIPASIGLVQTLEVIRLDNNNKLSSTVPSSIGNLTKLNVLNLANNSFTGQMPNLTTLTNLNYLDLSQNQFDASEVPSWISSLTNLRTLKIESGRLQGEIPQDLFSFSHIQEVRLNNNSLNGTFSMGTDISGTLNLINLEFNAITSITLSSNYNKKIMIAGNPVCTNPYLSLTTYCLSDQNSAVQSTLNKTGCSNPLTGFLIFRAPFFSDASPYIANLEQNLTNTLKSCTPIDLSVQNYYFDPTSYLWIQVELCPVEEKYFNRSEILNCFDLNAQSYRPPENYGPFYFTATPYKFPSSEKYIIGIAVGCTVLGVALVCLGAYAIRQRKRAQREINRNDPFASWATLGQESGDAPKLSGAKAFTYDELKNYTNNFRQINIIGSGGYGKVYRGMLPNGQIVAIKRGKEGSMQGGLEFKTEIELLSRVHHKNLVSLVGFCFEKGERMLVYEFISKGTLRDSLSGSSGIQLDWGTRLRITLDSARGLAYLHDHANPPIIHRDVKSTNILLDENLTAKVSDFGLSLFVMDTEIGQVTMHVKGTLGYLDPEYYMTQQLTGKSDVYSFGVVMLEIVTGQPPLKDKNYIVRDVKTALNKKDREYLGLKDIIDPILIYENQTLIGLERFVDIALKCVEDASNDRPTMNEIVKEIEAILQAGGFKMNSGLSSWVNTNAAFKRYSFDGSSSSTTRNNITSNDFKYSGGFPNSR
ncbi:hypothetical protein LUZ60_004046 [Juncus effusus]|nr:hypothetical protein LUZ60_004046 [Juncus effusus]